MLSKKEIILIVVIIILSTIITPIILGQIIRLPFGNLTIGDENSWVSFFGSYLGGIFGMVGVIFTTYIIIKKNKENIVYSMKLEDKQVRDREVTTILLNKSEQVAEVLENFNGLLTQSVSLFIRMSININTINNLNRLKAQADPSERESIEDEIRMFRMTQEELSDKSLSVRPLVIDSLNKAIAKSIFFNEIRNDIISLKEFIIEEEGSITDAIYRVNHNQVDQMGKKLIEDVSDKINPIQAKIARFSSSQLSKLQKGEE
ncbi:hypothetical protein ACNRWW_14105 [Metabacillus sp. HB246100]